MENLSTELMQKIAGWKAKWGVVHLLELEDRFGQTRPWIYRSLTGAEIVAFRELAESSPSADWDLVIAETCLLEPSVKDALPGTVVTVASEVLARSQLDADQLKEEVKDLRDWAKKSAGADFILKLVIEVCKAYPAINLLDLLRSSSDQILRVAGLVELSTGKELFRTGPAKMSKRRPTGPPTTPEQQMAVSRSAQLLKEQIEAQRAQRKKSTTSNKE